ncbi:TetR/AcrR family transcriptional regulator [Nesterenkonia jeotgali]|uniref:AcrR family transcriptional regulator n=1 Tax=Nesterenkonia jeotgali TaxID=317018 RepID=A0A0W8IC60_9MICC|nr:TetR/AcrR family transcriptional regulator [Nesterenkonia jeotgali]KUG57531.1 TetR family transcriptional regulator [Nesterenkonia jeotgali]MBA8922357.1 AcrR family transcriptional regulator [Nesterenkonia jeotgali]
MRPSKRREILDAATRVVQREGVTTLTYESVAAEAGMTKGGLLYHFPSREELLLGLHRHVAQNWELALEAQAGGAAHELSRDERFRAFVRLSQNPERAELLLMLEASEDPVANAAWDEIFARWAPQPPEVPQPSDARDPHGAQDPQVPDDDAVQAAAVQRFIARLAADGLWFYEALSTERLDPRLRERVTEEIIALAQGAAVPAE